MRTWSSVGARLRLDHDGVVGGELAVQQALRAERRAGRAQVVGGAELAVVVRRR